MWARRCQIFMCAELPINTFDACMAYAQKIVFNVGKVEVAHNWLSLDFWLEIFILK